MPHRLTAFGTQLLEVHAWLRDELAELRDHVEARLSGRADATGFANAPDLRAHCLTFCETLTKHHTDEDDTVFPVLAAKYPELREVLAGLRSDHNHVSWLLQSMRKLVTSIPDDPTPEQAVKTRTSLNELEAVLTTHLIGEEKRIVGALNSLGVHLLPEDAVIAALPDGAY